MDGSTSDPVVFDHDAEDPIYCSKQACPENIKAAFQVLAGGQMSIHLIPHLEEVWRAIEKVPEMNRLEQHIFSSIVMNLWVTSGFAAQAEYERIRRDAGKARVDNLLLPPTKKILLAPTH